MKNVICLWGTMGILAFAVATRGADGLTQTLQHGLYEEEANQNLDAAIKSYQAVIDQSQEQRKVVATALFRLGECTASSARPTKPARSISGSSAISPSRSSW